MHLLLSSSSLQGALSSVRVVSHRAGRASPESWQRGIKLALGILGPASLDMTAAVDCRCMRVRLQMDVCDAYDATDKVDI